MLPLTAFLRVFLHHKTSIMTLSGSFKGNWFRPKAIQGGAHVPLNQFSNFSKTSFQIPVSNATPLHYAMTQYSISNNNIQKCLHITLWSSCCNQESFCGEARKRYLTNMHHSAWQFLLLERQDNDKNSHWQSELRTRSPTYSAVFCYHWQVTWLPENFLYQYLHLLSFSGKVSSNSEQDWRQVLSHFKTTCLMRDVLLLQTAENYLLNIFLQLRQHHQQKELSPQNLREQHQK